MKRYQPADWGSSLTGIKNSSGKGFFTAVELKWSKPETLTKTAAAPLFSDDEPILYAIIRDHGKQKRINNIRYIGLTVHPKARFSYHEIIRKLVALRGSTKFSFAVVNIKGRNKELRTKAALEAIEHILIWALWAVDHQLDNEKKQNMLPGLGTNGASAWHIKNGGYRFSGRMPLEIVYPWMLLKGGRDRSSR